MKPLKLLSYPVIKLAKGLLLIHLILFMSMLIVQSCKKSDTVRKDNAAEIFFAAVKKHKEAIGAISVKPVNKNIGNRNIMARTNDEEPITYISFDDMPINPDYSYDINGMAYLVNNYNGVVTYEPSDSSYAFQIPVEDVNNSLTPLIPEARTYLNARGLTNGDIDAMVQEEGALEVDLVPYAASLAEYENSGTTGMNYINLFGNSAYAQNVLTCAAKALGVDALWALGGSNASLWTKAAMKTAFKAVAKRALGPIGVAIAVVSFGLCMADVL